MHSEEFSRRLVLYLIYKDIYIIFLGLDGAEYVMVDKSRCSDLSE